MGEFFEKYQNTVYLQDEEEYRQISIRNTGVVEYRCTNKGKNIGRKRQYLIDTDTHPVTLTFTRQTVYEGGIGFVPKELNGAIVTENMPLLEMTNASQDFMKALFNTSGYYKSVINDDTLIGSAQKALHEKQWLDSYVCIPVLDEQKQIGSFFQQLEHLITLHQRKYDKLQVLKKAMLEKMFPKNGSSVPEIRFKGFTDAWEQRKLGDIMNVTSVKRIHQSDWTDSGVRFLRARDIVSASKNEEPDDYLYISKEKYDEYSLISGKVSVGDLLVTGVGTIGVPYLIRNSEPLYFKDGNIIWFQNGTKIDGDFFLYSFFGKAIQDFINESAGIGTVGTYTIESGKKTPISLPEMKEQQQIGAYFRNLDNLITLHQRELEKLQNIKKSMLEKMFV